MRASRRAGSGVPLGEQVGVGRVRLGVQGEARHGLRGEGEGGVKAAHGRELAGGHGPGGEQFGLGLAALLEQREDLLGWVDLGSDGAVHGESGAVGDLAAQLGAQVGRGGLAGGVRARPADRLDDLLGRVDVGVERRAERGRGRLRVATPARQLGLDAVHDRRFGGPRQQLIDQLLRLGQVATTAEAAGELAGAVELVRGERVVGAHDSDAGVALARGPLDAQAREAGVLGEAGRRRVDAGQRRGRAVERGVEEGDVAVGVDRQRIGREHELVAGAGGRQLAREDVEVRRDGLPGAVRGVAAGAREELARAVSLAERGASPGGEQQQLAVLGPPGERLVEHSERLVEAAVAVEGVVQGLGRAGEAAAEAFEAGAQEGERLAQGADLLTRRHVETGAGAIGALETGREAEQRAAGLRAALAEAQQPELAVGGRLLRREPHAPAQQRLGAGVRATVAEQVLGQQLIEDRVTAGKVVERGTALRDVAERREAAQAQHLQRARGRVPGELVSDRGEHRGRVVVVAGELTRRGGRDDVAGCAGLELGDRGAGPRPIVDPERVGHHERELLQLAVRQVQRRELGGASGRREHHAVRAAPGLAGQQRVGVDQHDLGRAGVADGEHPQRRVIADDGLRVRAGRLLRAQGERQAAVEQVDRAVPGDRELAGGEAAAAGPQALAGDGRAVEADLVGDRQVLGRLAEEQTDRRERRRAAGLVGLAHRRHREADPTRSDAGLEAVGQHAEARAVRGAGEADRLVALSAVVGGLGRHRGQRVHQPRLRAHKQRRGALDAGPGRARAVAGQLELAQLQDQAAALDLPGRVAEQRRRLVEPAEPMQQIGRDADRRREMGAQPQRLAGGRQRLLGPIGEREDPAARDRGPDWIGSIEVGARQLVLGRREVAQLGQRLRSRAADIGPQRGLQRLCYQAIEALERGVGAVALVHVVRVTVGRGRVVRRLSVCAQEQQRRGPRSTDRVEHTTAEDAGLRRAPRERMTEAERASIGLDVQAALVQRRDLRAVVRAWLGGVGRGRGGHSSLVTASASRTRRPVLANTDKLRRSERSSRICPSRSSRCPVMIRRRPSPIAISRPSRSSTKAGDGYHTVHAPTMTANTPSRPVIVRCRPRSASVAARSRSSIGRTTTRSSPRSITTAGAVAGATSQHRGIGRRPSSGGGRRRTPASASRSGAPGGRTRGAADFRAATFRGDGGPT
jgi:hypothetical protein